MILTNCDLLPCNINALIVKYISIPVCFQSMSVIVNYRAKRLKLQLTQH